MEIEQIEQWKGQYVVDCDGEKIGKLEDIYFEAGSREAAFGTVKTGRLGRKHILVPLAGAKVSRDHVRVAYAQDRVKEGPQVELAGTLESDLQEELAQHYELPDATAAGRRRYESASARGAREARAREATKRAEELEALAERKRAEARAGELQADDTRRQARQAQDEHDLAAKKAAEARAEAETEQPPSE